MIEEPFAMDNAIVREPYGICRWCGDDNSDGAGAMWIRVDGEGEWYECWACCQALCDDPSLDADDVVCQSVVIRAGREYR